MSKYKAEYAVTNAGVNISFYEDGVCIDSIFYGDDEIEDMVFGDELPYLPCGCTVEPDGRCYHGVKSPLIVLGVI